MKNLLSLAFVATLLTIGSLKAEEPKTTQMKPGHTVESHKMNAGHPAASHQNNAGHPAEGAPHKMNAGQAAKPLQMKGENAHGVPHGGQGHQHDAHNPLPNMPVRNADTHHQMEHGTPHNAAVHKNVSSWGQPWPKLSGADQVLYKKNMNDILVLQNGLFNNPQLTGDSGFNEAVYNGTFIRNILQTCDGFCQDTNQDRCAFVDGLKNSHGLSIPADRQAFLTCFHKGVVTQPSHGGIVGGWGPKAVCEFNCTGGGRDFYGNPTANVCGDNKMRQGCKLLCCTANGVIGSMIGHCLENNGDGCDGF